MRFAIFGAGFGLYGYLPALVTGCDAMVYLPESYRSVLASREDIRCLTEIVNWSIDKEAALSVVDAVVISQRPTDQARWIRELVDRPNIQALLLEKPLAVTPREAADALNALQRSGKRHRINLGFRFTPWAAVLKEELCSRAPTDSFYINWQFRAHHYLNDLRTWKRFVSSGGGAIRFFGIHLIGLLAEMGFDTVLQSSASAASQDECETWSAAFTGPHLPECRVQVNSNSDQQCFLIDRIGGASGAKHIVALNDPFEASTDVSGFDRRIGVLTALCKDLIDGPAPSYPWYQQSIRLWDMVERIC